MTNLCDKLYLKYEFFAKIKILLEKEKKHKILRIIQKSWHIAVLRFADENFLLQNYIVKHSLEMLHICYPQSYKIVISKVKKHIANIIFF